MLLLLRVSLAINRQSRYGCLRSCFGLETSSPTIVWMTCVAGQHKSTQHTADRHDLPRCCHLMHRQGSAQIAQPRSFQQTQRQGGRRRYRDIPSTEPACALLYQTRRPRTCSDSISMVRMASRRHQQATYIPVIDSAKANAETSKPA